jgi:biopolymer transport protein ExbB
MFSYLMQGGLLMIPIALCSVLSLAFAGERIWFLWEEYIPDDALWAEIEPLIDKGNYEEALEVAQQYDGLLADLVQAGLAVEPRHKEKMIDRMESYGLNQVPRLERFLPALNFIAQVSPLLGLLGTVAGMIETFSVIASAGVGQPELLAGGISKALITTASGLAIGIITLFFHHVFSQRIDRITHKMEQSVRRFEDAIEQQDHRESE